MPQLPASCFSLFTCKLVLSAFALSVDGRRALSLSPLPLFVVPSSPKAPRDEQTNRRQREVRIGAPPHSPIYLSPLRALCQTSFQALKSSKSTHCRNHCHLAELGHSGALGGQSSSSSSSLHSLPSQMNKMLFGMVLQRPGSLYR